MIVMLLENAVTVTGFVVAMMLLVEYANVATRGVVRAPLAGLSWSRDRVLLAGGLLAFAVALGYGAMLLGL